MDLKQIITDNLLDHLPEGAEISEKIITATIKAINKAVGETTLPKEWHSKKVLEWEKEKKELEDALNEANGEGAKLADIKNDLAKALKDLADEKADRAAEKEAADIDNLVSAALKAAGMNEAVIPKALKLYDRAIVERKDGKIANADKMLEHFKAEWADFFGKTHQKGANVGESGGGAASHGKTLRELMIEANTNPNRITEVLARVDTISKANKENET